MFFINGGESIGRIWSRPSRGKGHMKPPDEEIRRLQRENEELREEKEILKKALAIFSKHPN
jgi:transposase-like protein